MSDYVRTSVVNLPFIGWYMVMVSTQWAARGRIDGIRVAAAINNGRPGDAAFAGSW